MIRKLVHVVSPPIATALLQATGELDITGEQTDVQTGTVNNFTLNANVAVLRWNSGSSSNVTINGFTGGFPGRTIFVVNENTSGSILLNHESASATATNRLTLAAQGFWAITAGGTGIFRYDGTRWRSIALLTTQINAAMNFAGAVSVTGSSFSSSSTLTASATVVTPSALNVALSATNDDWSPSSSAYRYRVSAVAASAISGLAQAVTNGRNAIIQNTSAFNVTLKHEGTGSTAANRFACPSNVDLVIQPGGVVRLVYDGTSARWLVVATSGCYSQASNTLLGNPNGFLAAGFYYFPSEASSISTSNTLGNGNLYAWPVFIPNAITVNRLFAEVTVIGDVGSKVRLGIYADDGTQAPGALITDAGTINGDSVAVQEVTPGAPPSIGPGWYWLAAVVQNVTTTQPTVRTQTSTNTYRPTTRLTALPGAGNMPVSCKHNAGVTGALPGTFVPVFNQSFALRMGIKT